MQNFENDFEVLLDKMKVERVVVFIDDLDRCSSEKLIQAFETIKLFLNVPESTFVIGADATKIEAAITEIYGAAGDVVPRGGSPRTLAEEYLEKIVQIPFRIPEQRLPDSRHEGTDSEQIDAAPKDYSIESVEPWSAGTNHLLRSMGLANSKTASIATSKTTRAAGSTS